MAKKKPLDDVDDIPVPAFSPASQTVNKLPLDISDGKTPINEYMMIPVDRIDPYANKQGSDFQRHGEGLKQAMIDSIREVGVIEPLTVRPKPNGRFELLAGESRWEHAKAAGLKKVPCHIVQADDQKARTIFSLTNLLRRDMSIRDRINGWWHFYEAQREQGKLNELRKGKPDSELQKVASENGGMLNWRQILRYVKMHELISPWIDKLDEKKTSMRVAYRVAFFPEDVQTALLEYELDENSVEYLYSIFDGNVEGVTWDIEKIPEYLGKKKAPEKKTDENSARAMFTRAKPNIIKAAKASLRVEDYDRAEEVISLALEQYYKSHT